MEYRERQMIQAHFIGQADFLGACLFICFLFVICKARKLELIMKLVNGEAQKFDLFTL